ncbi:hypothetical protein [Endomicrobium proavitum]|uniref:Uncharacterized protein n=1 Tax=Endomicrobium proavitum TaxID=1408281 RepID=A0A0G3WKH3_9BACT|nr:hypothetical protein [Endomicrobium proavitum]AKL98387.1 membrane protein of unknown function [Endomicrobium proavitum]
MPEVSDNKKSNQVLMKCAIIVAAVLFVEIFGFNMQSFFNTGLRQYAIDPSFVSANPAEMQYGADKKLHLNPQLQTASFALGANVPVKNISLTVSGAPQIANVRVFARDSDEKFKPSLVYNKLFAVKTSGSEVFLKVKSRGNLQDVIFEISKNANADFAVSQIKLNVTPPFNFSWLRFFVILLPVLFIIFSRSYGWHKTVTDLNDKTYKKASAAALCLAVLFSFFIYKASTGLGKPTSVSYPFNAAQNTADPYLLVFDAFKKGQTHLDITPDPKLIALGQNAYSQGARENAQAYALHDYAFFKGKYYVYFGAAPVILIYYPYYMLTGSLPSAEKTTFILSLLCIVFIFGAYMQVVKTFCKKVNLMLLLATYLAILFGSLIFMLQLFAYRYEIAHLGGYLFLSASIYFAFKAYNRIETLGEKSKGALFLLLAGITFICIGFTRPNVLLVGFAFLLPAALKILSNKNISLNYKKKISAAFVAPCIAGLALIFYYNFARFGSISDFGTTHNLSGIVIREFNPEMILRLPRAIFYYFFDMPEFSPVFPWIRSAIHTYNVSGSAFYGDVNAGIMLIPLTWGLFLWWKKNPEYSKNDSLLKTTAWAAFAGTAVSLIVLYGLSGVVTRYSCDVRLCLFLLAGVFMLNCYNNIEGDAAKSLIFKIFAAACALSVFFGFCLTFGGNWEMWNLVKNNSPEIYAKLFNLFI